MMNQIRSSLLSASALSVLSLLAPSSSWAATHMAADGTACGNCILDIGGTASSPGESKQEIKLTKRWEQARAVYLSDLDNAVLDSKPAVVDSKQVPQDYRPMHDLIEAKYQLAIAEGQLIVPNLDKQAIADVQRAQSFLAHALKHVDADDKAKFTNIKGKVDYILQSVSHGRGCWSERLSEAFDNVDYDVEKALHSSWPGSPLAISSSKKQSHRRSI
jgi:hypothetical protein